METSPFLPPIMQLNYDLYISYAPADNQVSAEGTKGWVSNFQFFLNRVLSQVLSEDPIFLHYQNQEKPTGEQLEKVGILLCIISPTYVRKASCVEDIMLFTEAQTRAGVSPEDIRNRIFKIVKYPVADDELPSSIKDQLAYDLFVRNPANGTVDEIKDFLGSGAESNFWVKMLDLGYDIQDVLNSLRDNDKRRSLIAVGEGKAIYLAETSPDLLLQRNIIKRELQRYGYKVLPDHALPTNVREMEAIIRKDLENCQMSIHLIGSMYGEVPKGSENSIIEIQNRFAAERSHLAAVMQKSQEDPNFSRFIWLSPEMNLINERQMKFIESLKKQVEDEETAEVVQTSLEDFKTLIRSQLGADVRVKETESKFVAGSSRRQATAKVYLVYDKIDRSAITPIVQYINERGFEVIQPAFEGNLLDIQKQHVENLKEFDLAIIYQGMVGEQWVRMKILDLLKAPGYGRKKPVIAKALLAGKGARNFDYAENFDVDIINNTSALRTEDLESLLRMAEE
jgi:hypothetical protein